MNTTLRLTVLALSLACSLLWAGTIDIENYSFEVPGVGKPFFDTIPGWDRLDDGAIDYAGAEQGYGPTDGLYTAFLGLNGKIGQLTGHVVQAGDIFTLTFHARSTWQGDTLAVAFYYLGEDDQPVEVSVTKIDLTQAATMQEFVVTFDSADAPEIADHRIGISFQHLLEIGSDSNIWAGLDEILLEVESGSVAIAVAPHPIKNETDVVTTPVLSWLPGLYAQHHDVYFGTSQADVNSADRNTPLGVLLAQDHDTNSIAVGPLELGTTYYWRVDEVNGPPDYTIHTGDLWSFTVEPVAFPAEGVVATSSSDFKPEYPAENLVNGSGLNELDQHGTDGKTMWISGQGATAWLSFDLGKARKLHQMLVWNANQDVEIFLGRGVKDAKVELSQDGQTWTTLYDSIEIARATFAEDYVYNTVIDLQGLIARYVRLTCLSNWGGTFPQFSLAEVRLTYIPVRARRPEPSDGAQAKRLAPPLRFRSGRTAVQHELYLSADANLVAAADPAVHIATLSDPELDTTGLLQYQQEVYWRVDEVTDDANAPLVAGDVWRFSTPDQQSVDDFESYTDDDGQRIYQSWIDGWDVPANGSQVGYTNSPFAELTVVHGGKQSMPFLYGSSNGATYSEATLALAPAQDWTAGGLRYLLLYFNGKPDNSPGQLYVKIGSNRVDYPTPSHLTRRAWTPWLIDLSGLPVQSVASLTVGVDGYGAGDGLLLIDDVSLMRIPPQDALPLNPTDPGSDQLIAQYDFEGTLQDGSGNSHHGTAVGSPAYQGGVDGQALWLNGASAVDLGNDPVWNPAGSFSVSLWANANNWSEAWGCVMMSNRGEGAQGWQIRKYSSTDNLCFTTRGVGSDDMQSKALMPLNEWVHVVCVYDAEAGVKSLYVNGVLDISAGAGGVIGVTEHNTYIGARAVEDNSTQEGFFDGMIDAVKVYDRALSPDEAAFLALP